MKIIKRLTSLVLSVLIVLTVSGCTGQRAGSGEEGFFYRLSANIFGECDQEAQALPDFVFSDTGYERVRSDYAYRCLETDAQRVAYRSIESGMNLITDIDGGEFGAFRIKNIILPSLTSAEIYKVKEAVIADHPEAFWINGQYTLGYNMHDGDYIVLYSDYGYEDLLKKHSAFEEEINRMITSVPGGLSEYERELFLHDLIVRSADYNTQAVDAPQDYREAYNAYGVVVSKKAVCSGYAPAMKLLLNLCGIECITVNGTSKDQGHMWNAVCIDDSWYQLDVTWNDPIQKTTASIMYYDYFNLPDEKMMLDHDYAVGFDVLTNEMIEAEEYSGPDFFNFDLPECTSTAETYYIKNSLHIKSLNRKAQKELTSFMTSVLTSGENTVYILFDETIDMSEASKWLMEGDRCAVQIAANETNIRLRGQEITHFIPHYYVQDESLPVPIWNNLIVIELECRSR